MGLFRRGDRIRTCRVCGEEWRVARALAKPFRPSRWRVGLQRGDVRAAGRAVNSMNVDLALNDARMRAADTEHERELIAQLRQCPKCGATDYDQR